MIGKILFEEYCVYSTVIFKYFFTFFFIKIKLREKYYLGKFFILCYNENFISDFIYINFYISFMKISKKSLNFAN